MSTLSALSIFPATPEQIVESRKRSFVAWGRALSLDAYLARDAKIDVSEIGRDHRLVTWVLAPRESPQTLDFMCSCETFRRDGLLTTPPQKTVERVSVNATICYGIASVFTPAHKRGKGYARHMMKLLHWVLAPPVSLPHSFPAEWGARPLRPNFVEPGCCSVLYSDVGADFYGHCGPGPDSNDGWLVAKPNSTRWNVQRVLEVSSSKGEVSIPWVLLDDGCINAISSMDVELIQAEMAEGEDGLTEFTFLPTHGLASSQYTRLEGYWKALTPLPKYWGVCLSDPDENIDASTFATWTLDTSPAQNSLIITRLRSAPHLFERLLSIIADYAKQYSIETIEVWNLPEDLASVASYLGGCTFARDEHLPAIKWYGIEDAKDVSWIHNEKFCWC